MAMLEKVARAIAEHNEPGMWDRTAGENWAWRKGYINDARAAIEALREPSEGMRKAASECAFDRATFAYPKGHASYEVHVSAEEYWQAMIDFILNEQAS